MWNIPLLNPCIYKSDFTCVNYACKNYKCNFFIKLTPGFSLLKRELVEEDNLAIKKLKSTASLAPKFKKKRNEKQNEVNSSV